MPSFATSLRVLNTTLQHWVKGFSDETEEDHPILAALRAKGRTSYDASGTQYEETIKYRRLNLAGYGDMQRLRWARNNTKKKQILPWRGLKMTDAMSDLELRQNQGMEARVNEFANKLEHMRQDAEDDLGQFFYKDGNNPANAQELHGIQSFTSTTGNLTTDAFATTLNDTYGNLGTARGQYGGAVKGGGTPAGTNFESIDPEFDFWSFVGVNATYDPGGDPHTWQTRALDLIGRAASHAIRGNKKSHQTDLLTMSRNNYNELKIQARDKERIIVDPGNRSLLVQLGFKRVMQVDGIDCIIDPDIPELTDQGEVVRAYGWNFKKMKMCLLPKPGEGRKRLFWNSSGSHFDPNDQVFKFWCGLWGQLVFKPRYFICIADYA